MNDTDDNERSSEKVEPKRKILDGLANATASQWKEAWEKAADMERRKEKDLKERIEEGRRKGTLRPPRSGM